MRILLVEDERKVADFIKKGLTEEGYAVDCAADGKEGMFMAEESNYDLIVLDILLPQFDGFQICRSLREKGISSRIIMLTAMDSTEDKIKGLDTGADDYLTKPFSFEELLARIRALLRRGQSGTQAKLEVADLTLDPRTRQVIRAGKEIKLSNKEYAILEYFMRNPGRVLTRTLLSEHVWNYDFESYTNVVDVYVNYLRNKIDRDFKPKLIHTVRGVGYVLEVRESSDDLPL
jgi:heavy metal response regulator